MTFFEPSRLTSKEKRRVNDQKEAVLKKRVLAGTYGEKFGKLASRSCMYSFQHPSCRCCSIGGLRTYGLDVILPSFQHWPEFRKQL